MHNDINKYISNTDISLVEAMQKIDDGAQGIIFVVDDANCLVGCVTDGDIRRWIIKTADLNAKVADFMFKNPKYVISGECINYTEYMNQYSVNALPILDRNKKITDIVFRKNDTVKADNDRVLSNVPVVIMAGGKGTRLYPYTKILPKPLIPIGDVPIMERIIDKFVACGAEEFFITVNYKKSMIKSYFEDLNPKYRINYVEENKPLGTGGSLKLIDRKFDKPIFITNCDILINADLSDMYEQHIKSGNAVTIISSLKNIVVPYGVLKVKEQGIIEEMQEKPKLSYFVNTGVYIINPELIDYIPDDTFYHMPQLADKAMELGLKVGMYPVSEDAFLDMGEIEEMKRMEEKLKV